MAERKVWAAIYLAEDGEWILSNRRMTTKEIDKVFSISFDLVLDDFDYESHTHPISATCILDCSEEQAREKVDAWNSGKEEPPYVDKLSLFLEELLNNDEEEKNG